MTKIKYTLMIVLAGLFAITLNSCKKNLNEDPRARIINNGTQKASVQIKTSNGNTVNINNVDPGTSSPYNSYAAGQVTFTIDVNSIDYVKILDIGNGYDYDIAIDANNIITTKSIRRN
ncbi:MAG: hypothetical protein ABIN48_11995 [Ginsengibacter sp.]